MPDLVGLGRQASDGLSRTCRALLAVCLLAVGAQAEDAAADAKPTGVYLPTTPNDYSGMIYSLLQEQTNRVMNKDGATVLFSAHYPPSLFCPTFLQLACSNKKNLPESVTIHLLMLCTGMQDEGNPLNLLASMAGWAQQAQTALFTMAPPVNADGTPASSSSLQSSKSRATVMKGAPRSCYLTTFRASSMQLWPLLQDWSVMDGEIYSSLFQVQSGQHMVVHLSTGSPQFLLAASHGDAKAGF